ncbi:MAG: MgtC/SapB family protein [archaeon]
MNNYILFFRISLTFVLSFIFGWQRQRAHKPVGFGTYTFVSVGAASLAITAVNLAPDNPLSLIGAIVTGVGFLGAGALIKTSDKIFGFTSASTIWLYAIFGIGIGVGEYFIAFLIYVVTWIVVMYDTYLEGRGIGSYQRRLEIVTHKIINDSDIKKVLFTETKKHTLLGEEVDKKNGRMIFRYQVEGTKEHLNKIPKRLYEEPWFESCKIE